MRVYLDNCCYNRSFDGQGDFRVAMDTQANSIRDKPRLDNFANAIRKSAEWLRGKFKQFEHQELPQSGYEILPNKDFYEYKPPIEIRAPLKEFRALEAEADELLKGLAA